MAVTINMFGDVRYRLGYIGEENEQCLFLYRKGVLGRSAAIPLSAAWKYVPDMDKDGNPVDGMSHMQAAIFAAGSVCKALDMPTDKPTIMRTIMKIQDLLPRLLTLPPYIDPVEEAVRAMVTMDGKTYEASGADTQRDNMGIKVAH